MPKSGNYFRIAIILLQQGVFRMKKLAKLTAVFAALVMAFSFAACSDDDDGGSSSSPLTSTVYKGSFSVGGISYSTLTMQSNKTYTMGGANSQSDKGTWSIAESNRAAVQKIVNDGDYIFISETHNGNFSVTVTDTGITLASGTGDNPLSASGTGEISASQTDEDTENVENNEKSDENPGDSDDNENPVKDDNEKTDENSEAPNDTEGSGNGGNEGDEGSVATPIAVLQYYYDYYVTYDPNGGTIDEEKQHSSNPDSSNLQLPTAEELGLSRDGYTFVGWAVTEEPTARDVLYADGEMIALYDFDKRENYSTERPGAINVKLYAVWLIPESGATYTVSPKAISPLLKAIADTNPEGETEATLVINEIYYDRDTYVKWHITRDSLGNGDSIYFNNVLGENTSVKVSLDLSQLLLSDTSNEYMADVRRCTNLVSLILPNVMTSIGKNDYWNCTGLKIITIPASVTLIDDDAFTGCTSLENIIFNGTQEQWEAVEKKWARLSSLKTITCTDGTISLAD